LRGRPGRNRLRQTKLLGLLARPRVIGRNPVREVGQRRRSHIMRDHVEERMVEKGGCMCLDEKARACVGAPREGLARAQPPPPGLGAIIENRRIVGRPQDARGV
jgi:hypothetical protein